MNQLDEIRDLIEEIADPDRKQRFPTMMGTVVTGSYDADAGTVSVVLASDNEDAPTEGVLINGAHSVADGLLLVPADGSIVWVSEIDGGGKWGIVKYSALASATVSIGNAVVYVHDGEVSMAVAGKDIIVKSDKIAINGGSLGGAVKSSAVSQQDNLFVTDLTMLKGILGGIIATLGAAPAAVPVLNSTLLTFLTPLSAYVSAALTPPIPTQYENPNLTHG